MEEDLKKLKRKKKPSPENTLEVSKSIFIPKHELNMYGLNKGMLLTRI